MRSFATWLNDFRLGMSMYELHQPVYFQYCRFPFFSLVAHLAALVQLFGLVRRRISRYNDFRSQLSMKVPEPLRKVFDTFPLVSYVETEANSNSYLSEGYFFRTSNETSLGAEVFTLGVHNVRLLKLKDGQARAIPTDPSSLSAALIMCHRHDLKLPDGSEQCNSPHRMLPMSYLGAPSNELPILIETKQGSTLSITEVLLILESISSKYFSECASSCLINQFLDSLNDLWIFALLIDIPRSDPSAFLLIFRQDPEISSHTVANDILLSKSIADISHWNSFKTKYAHLFKNSSKLHDVTSYLRLKSFSEFLSVSDTEALESAYFSKLLDFESSLPLFAKLLESGDTSDLSILISLKFCAFLICVDEFIPENSHLGRALKFKYSEIVQLSRETLLQY